MLLLVPADSPPWALEACAQAPHPAALLRTGQASAPSFLLRFPLVLDPEGIAPPERKDDLVLVSPQYPWIEWAKGRGLRAVWLNPQGTPCPTVHPLHDLELRSPAGLREPLVFSLPDLADGLGILRAHGVPENVVRHSLAVAAVAHFLAARLRDRGLPVDPLLAHRGGLLHDLDKIDSIRENLDHGLPAAERLSALGYPALAEIAKRHVLRPDRSPQTWEEKLVCYADKLVEGDRVVGLAGRLSALRARYPAFSQDIRAGEAFLRDLEGELLLALGVSGAELLRELQGLKLALPEPFSELAAR